MGTSTTLWPLAEHTKGKHAVLKSYLDAWLPILSKFRGRVLIIDGFAGPGRYSGGEEGSPLIAIRCVREHTASAMISEVVCLFIEADKTNAEHLEAVLEELRADGKIPTKCKCRVLHGDFDEGLAKVLDYVDEQKKRLAPAFVMIDPFGVSQTPMSVIQRLFTNDKVEVYVSFMYEWVNRFKKSSAFEPHLDELFGTEEWRDGLAIEDSQERKTFFFDLYEDQLRKAGAMYVVRFELFSGNRLKYAIFFATCHLLGADKMKQAIWKIAPTGDYAFRGGRSEQLALGLDAPDFGPLRRAIEGFLGSRKVGSWVKVEEVAEFVVASTDYHSSQFKTNALRPLESNGKIEVDPTSRTRRGSYPDGTRLRLKRD